MIGRWIIFVGIEVVAMFVGVGMVTALGIRV